MNKKSILKSRSIIHWTPRYIFDRLHQLLWIKRNPDMPWLSRDCNYFLNQWLNKSDNAIEWGSGRSTIWFANRVNHIISIEDKLEWYERVKELLKSGSINNITYKYVHRNYDSKDILHYSNAAINEVEDESISFILVDGKYRDHCALAGLKKLKKGGILVIDDAHRYIPSESRSPGAIPMEGTPPGKWPEVLEQISEWRCIWFYDGVLSDAVYFKPI